MDETTTTANEPAGGSRMSAGWKAFAVVVLLVAVGAVAAAGFLWTELDDLRENSRRTTSGIQSDLSDAERRISRLESDVGMSVGFDSLDRQIADLKSDLAALARRIDEVDDRIPRSLEFELGMVATAVGDLRECINEYMDVVARAGGGRYEFYFC